MMRTISLITLLLALACPTPAQERASHAARARAYQAVIRDLQASGRKDLARQLARRLGEIMHGERGVPRPGQENPRQRRQAAAHRRARARHQPPARPRKERGARERKRTEVRGKREAALRKKAELAKKRDAMRKKALVAREKALIAFKKRTQLGASRASRNRKHESTRRQGIVLRKVQQPKTVHRQVVVPQRRVRYQVARPRTGADPLQALREEIRRLRAEVQQMRRLLDGVRR